MESINSSEGKTKTKIAKSRRSASWLVWCWCIHLKDNAVTNSEKEKRLSASGTAQMHENKRPELRKNKDYQLRSRVDCGMNIVASRKTSRGLQRFIVLPSQLTWPPIPASRIISSTRSAVNPLSKLVMKRRKSVAEMKPLPSLSKMLKAPRRSISLVMGSSFENESLIARNSENSIVPFPKENQVI